MIILETTTDSLQVSLAGNVATNQLPCIVSYRETTTTTFSPKRNVVNTNDTTDVDLVAAPGASAQRVIDFISIFNNDTTNAAVFTAIGNKPTNRTPAVGDEIVMITGVVTASGIPVDSPAIVAADTSDGVVKLLALDDATAKVKWGKDSGADLSANTYTCWVKPA